MKMELNDKLKHKCKEINVCKPAEVKDGDLVYIFQHPSGSNKVYISSSDCFVHGELSHCIIY